MKVKSHYAAYSPCRSMYREMLKAHLDKELSKPLARMVTLHLVKCYKCRTELDSLLSLSMSLKSTMQEIPSATLRERILSSTPQTAFIKHNNPSSKKLHKTLALISFASTAAAAVVIIPTLRHANLMKTKTGVSTKVKISNLSNQTKQKLNHYDNIATSLDPFNPHFVMQEYKPKQHDSKHLKVNNRLTIVPSTIRNENLFSSASQLQRMHRYLLETSNTSEAQNEISQWMRDSGGYLQQISIHAGSEDLTFSIDRNASPRVKHALSDILSGVQPPPISSKLRKAYTIRQLSTDGAVVPKLKPVPDNDDVYVMIRIADSSLKLNSGSNQK